MAPDRGSPFAFLKRRPAQILTFVLMAQAAVLYSVSRPEEELERQPLQGFPAAVGGWSMVEEGVIEEQVQRLLRADDAITRSYADAAGGRSASLFVAYFRSQRTGQAPHSPKNCLPGSGWVPMDSGVISIPVDGQAEPIEVNRYVIAKGESRSLVLYWYQSRHRVVASEYAAKFHLVADAIRYNRTDTTLVRIVVPIASQREQAAEETARSFVQAVFPVLRQRLPS